MSKEDVLARFAPGWPKSLDIGPGWYEIVFRLNEDLAALDPNYSIAQVKEKFGGLRYYININPEVGAEANRLIDIAECESENTCETCGNAGVLRTDLYWMRTLCDRDYQASKSR